MDRARIGFVGCGRMARHHGRRFVEEIPTPCPPLLGLRLVDAI